MAKHTLQSYLEQLNLNCPEFISKHLKNFIKTHLQKNSVPSSKENFDEALSEWIVTERNHAEGSLHQQYLIDINEKNPDKAESYYQVIEAVALAAQKRGDNSSNIISSHFARVDNTQSLLKEVRSDTHIYKWVASGSAGFMFFLSCGIAMSINPNLASIFAPLNGGNVGLTGWIAFGAIIAATLVVATIAYFISEPLLEKHYAAPKKARLSQLRDRVTDIEEKLEENKRANQAPDDGSPSLDSFVTVK